MILILLLWIVVFIACFVLGLSVLKLFCRLDSIVESTANTLDQYFFAGLLVLSSVTGILSIFMPLGGYVLYSVLLVSAVLSVVNFKDISKIATEIRKQTILFGRYDIIIASVVFIFLLASVAQKITLGDTESYHVQTIQWIRKYAVVPGLGHINSMLAFNSMYFTVSGLFTFETGKTLVFPLNSLSYLVLAVKLFVLYRNERTSGSLWKAVFYIVLLLISLLILLPDLNSPAPDVICAILVIYVFLFFIDLAGKGKAPDNSHVFLISLIAAGSIAFKLSSLFLALTVLFLLRKELIKRILIILSVFLVVLGPFFIRNYFLSGYLVYPLPELDLFSPDWKIPAVTAAADRITIEGWGRNWTIPPSEVVKMNFREWIKPWFLLQGINNKILILVNLLSVFSFFAMILKKEFFMAKIQVIVWLSLLFWLIMAPDPRFAYGFLFTGCAFAIAYPIRLLDEISPAITKKAMNALLIIFLAVVFIRRITPPLNTFLEPVRLIVPASFGSLEVNTFEKPFRYHVPVETGGCLNAELPCAPFPLVNVVMRGNNLQDGFKLTTAEPSGNK